MTPVSTLATYLCAAAYQRRLMYPCIMDKQFVEKGGKIFYAVDADIVKLYTAPEEMSIKKGFREGYAVIFPDDDPCISITLGRALADYIFNHLSGESHPFLLIIPPIEEDIQNVYSAVASDAEQEKEQAYSDLKKIQSLLDELKKETNKEKIVKTLIEEAPHISQLLAGKKGPTAELIRFNRLLTLIRIASPEFVLQEGWITDETVCHAFAPIEDVKGWMQIYDLREVWLNRLRETKSHRQDIETIDRDAHALARLEWINNHLDNNLYRLVYITGDHALHGAAKKYKPLEEKVSFDDLYLRHPRAYLAERGVLSPDINSSSEKSETKFMEWLDTFLSKFLSEGRYDTKELDTMLEKKHSSLENMLKPVSEIHPDIIKEFHDSWIAYTRNLIIFYGSQEPLDKIDNDTFNKLANDMEALIKQLDEQLKEKLRETWDACFNAAITAGYGMFYKHKKTKYHPRSAPPLVFNSLQETQKFVKNILASHKEGTLNSKAYKEAINKLLKEDGSGYSYNLAYALLFAAEGVWHVSAILAERAIDIARTCRPKNISGREAAFLRAYALRHSIRQMEDLDKLFPIIEEAEQYLCEDRSSRPNLKAGEIRFETERLAIYLCYNMFSSFLNKELPPDKPNLTQLQKMVQDLLNKLEEMKEDRWIKRNVERSLLTILFMTVLLRWGKEKEPIDPASMHPYYECFSKNIESEEPPLIEVPFQIKAIYLAAGLLTSKDTSKKEQLRQDLQRHLSDPNIKENSVFPYDEKRFNFLRDIVKQVI